MLILSLKCGDRNNLEKTDLSDRINSEKEFGIMPNSFIINQLFNRPTFQGHFSFSMFLFQ